MARQQKPERTTVLALDEPHGLRIEHIRAAKRLHLRNLTALALVFAGLIGFALSGNGSGEVASAAPGNPTDQIIVKFKSNASQSAIDALNASSAVQQVDAIPALGLKVLKIPPGKSAETVASAYKRNSNVQFAEVNALVKPELTASDPYFATSWHLPAISAPAAWDSAKASGVLIGICDTGVNAVADLAPVLRGDLGWNAADGTTVWSDIAGHGTQVAGVAAAVTNNSTGVSGVAWGAQVIPVRITNSTDGTASISAATKCITYAADKGARVINLSYLMAGSSSIDSAGTYARGKGALVTVAAGNNGQNPGWPNYPGFLAVSATGGDGVLPTTITSWSNYGAFVDIAAPGANIYTTNSSGGYWKSSGTSISSPVVAGVIALVFGAKPGLSADQAQSILLSNADDFGAAGIDPYHGNGHVNAARAVTSALGTASQPSPTPTASPSATATATPTSTATPAPSNDTTPPSVSITKPNDGQSIKGNTKLTVGASDNVAVAKVEIYVDGKLVKTLTSAPYSMQWNTRQLPNGQHSVKARAYDKSGNTAEDVHSVNITN